MAEDFKKALLASGLPLEYSTEAVLRRRQFRTVFGDFAFQRAGAQSEMSIDLAAEKRLFNEGLDRQVDGRIEGARFSADWKTLVECKYRSENIQWLFAPYEGPHPRLEEYHSTGLERRNHIVFGAVFSENDAPVRFVTFYPSGAIFKEPGAADLLAPVVCLRGIETRTPGASTDDRTDKHEAYSAQIRKAARQLQFAVLPFMWPSIREWLLRVRAESYRAPAATGVGFTSTFFSAYLVTNAELFMLNPDATIESIRGAKTISDVARPVPCIEFATSPSRELVEHHRHILSEFRDWRQIDLTNANERRFFELWEPVASRLDALSPSLTVVRYSAFESCLELHERALHETMTNWVGSWGKARGYGWA